MKAVPSHESVTGEEISDLDPVLFHDRQYFICTVSHAIHNDGLGCVLHAMPNILRFCGLKFDMVFFV